MLQIYPQLRTRRPTTGCRVPPQGSFAAAEAAPEIVAPCSWRKNSSGHAASLFVFLLLKSAVEPSSQTLSSQPRLADEPGRRYQSTKGSAEAGTAGGCSAESGMFS